MPADLAVGDVLATPVTGAYGHSMGSNYNKVPRPAVVFVADGEARVVVRRETSTTSSAPTSRSRTTAIGWGRGSGAAPTMAGAAPRRRPRGPRASACSAAATSAARSSS